MIYDECLIIEMERYAESLARDKINARYDVVADRGDQLYDCGRYRDYDDAARRAHELRPHYDRVWVQGSMRT